MELSICSEPAVYVPELAGCNDCDSLAAEVRAAKEAADNALAAADNALTVANAANTAAGDAESTASSAVSIANANRLKYTIDGTNNGVIQNDVDGNSVTGQYAIAEGEGNTSGGYASHAEGNANTVTGDGAHVEGWNNEVSGSNAHAEGNSNSVSSIGGHVEGGGNTVTGTTAHAGGADNTASGARSFAHGSHNNATENDQFVVGRYNKDTTTLFCVGNGTSDDERNNAFEVGTDGRIWISHRELRVHSLEVNPTVTFTGIPCAGYITASSKTLAFFVPHPLVLGGAASFQNLSISVRGGGYPYARSGSSGGTYTQLGNNEISMWENGAEKRSNEIASITCVPKIYAGYLVTMNFNYALTSNTTGTAFSNNIPVAVVCSASINLS